MADSSGFISGVAASVSATASAATQIGGSARKIGGDWAAGGAQAAASQQKMALEAKQLNNEIVLQTERLNALRAKFDESNPRVEKARLNIEALKLKMAELGREQQTASEHTSRFAGLMENAGSRIGSTFTGLVSGAARVGVALAQVAAIASGVFAAGVGAATTAIIGSVNAAANWGDQLDSIGDVLGTNARDSAALSVAITGVGGDVGNITTQMAFMSKGLVDEKGALGSTGQALKDLGISAFEVGKTYKANVPLTKMSAEETANLKRSLESATARYHDLGNTIAHSKKVTESQRVEYAHLGADIAAMSAKLGDAGKTVTKTFTEQGPMKDTAKLLQEVATKIDAMPDGLEKTSVMMKVFGKSGKDMSDTIHALAGSGLDEAREKAKLFGLDIGEDGVSNAVKFKRSLAEIKMMGQGLAVSLGSELMPVILPLISGFISLAQNAISPLRDGIKSIIAVFENTKAIGMGSAQTFQNVIRVMFGADAARMIQPFIDLLGKLKTGIEAFSGAKKLNLTDAQSFQNALRAMFGADAAKGFDAFRNVVHDVINWVQSNWPKIQATAENVFNTIRTVIQNVVGWVIANWPQISGVIGVVLAGVGSFVSTYLIPAVTAIATALGAVIAWVQANWPQISGVIQGVFDAIDVIVRTVIIPVAQFVIAEFSLVVGWVQANWPLIERTVTTVIHAIQTVFNAVFPIISQLVSDVFGTIKNVITTSIIAVQGIITAVMQAINGDWEGAWTSIFNVVRDINDGIKKFFSDLAVTLLDLGKNMIEGFVAGIKANGDSVVKTILEIINGAVEAVKKTLGIKSPSTVMAGIGANMALGLIGGYSAALKPLALPGFERAGGAFGGGVRVSNMRSQAKEDRAIVIHVHNEIGGKEVDSHIIRVVNGEIEGAALRYG